MRGGTTAIRVRVANTGTAIDRYWLTPNAYPGNWTMAIDPLETYVPPGQTTDFIVTLTLPNTASTGTQNVAVNLVANFVTRSVMTVPVNVVSNGVALSISPASGTPDTPMWQR